MGLFRHREAVTCTVCWAAIGFAGAQPRPSADPWTSAVAARQVFEAEPVGTHTRPEYTQVMDLFRAIYHGNPRDTHAARAAEQVAELLAEQGREFSDTKSLRDAAGQYVFVADAYPGGTRAANALERAAKLLGPEGVNDPAEARAVREQFASTYPDEAARASFTEQPSAKHAHPSEPKASTPEKIVHLPSADSRGVAPVSLAASADAPQPVTAEAGDVPPGNTRPQVTGIRHWSTSSYTRVAIDLGGEVQYQAARVENPDRIFFDLHHARLAPQLAGKSFTVTDDGFLTRIRAAQYSEDVTRVVLDVHQVTVYSAFLLPNPYRLIIDIHGKQEVENGKPERAGTTHEDVGTGQQAAASERVAPLQPSERPSTAATSSLPPMPVTDGSASFGLPSRSGSGSGTAVAEPRVVISSKPTMAKPVPNSVPVRSEATSTEVAAVSRQPGKIEATSKPTSAPISAKSTGAGPNPDSDMAQVARLDHYRKPVHHSATKSDPAFSEAEIDSTGPETKRQTSRMDAADGGVSASVVAPPFAGVHGRASAAPPSVPPPTADGETSLMRALGLKIGRIVIDAGHGGHDSGTIGADGIEEKDVVLDVALRLGKLLHDRLGAEIVYTRADDTFIPLETRTAIANKAQADLFLSVHANSSPDPSARGVEVYYLNFTSDPDAMRVASRENAVSTQSAYELSDLVKKIALKDKIDESRELAADVDRSLYAGLARGNEGLKDRGVKKAPFVVLIGANMPSILAEISFVTNLADAEELSRPAYRQRVAESIYAGVARYAGTINGSRSKAGTTQRAQR